MRPRLRRLLLLAAQTDALATFVDGAWSTRCLHCRSRIAIDARGEPLGRTTLEHVVPRAWFEHRTAAALVARVGAADDPRNLALACNHAKGKGPDERGPRDARAYEVVGALLDARLARWRDPPPRAAADD
jgi:hypothetical protein